MSDIEIKVAGKSAKIKALLVIVAVSVISPLALHYVLKEPKPEPVVIESPQEIPKSVNTHTNRMEQLLSEIIRTQIDLSAAFGVLQDQINDVKDIQDQALIKEFANQPSVDTNTVSLAIDQTEQHILKVLNSYFEDTVEQEDETEPPSVTAPSNTVKWLASPVMQTWRYDEENLVYQAVPNHKDSYRSLPSVQMGLRSDGTIVWREK